MFCEVADDGARAFLRSQRAGAEQVADGHADVWIAARDQDAIVAVAGMTLTKRTARVKGLFVMKTHRRQGLARELLRQLLIRCSGRRVTAFATVRSRPLFEEFGFVVVWHGSHNIVFMEKKEVI